jgi:hypothetical protein
MFALIAFALFLLAAFGVEWGETDLIALGLASLALALLVGNWPWGVIKIQRRNN